MNAVETDRFRVQLIPETQERTTLHGKGPGARVNLEGDLIGKYVARLYALRGAPEAAAQGAGLTEAVVRAAGFSPRG